MCKINLCCSLHTLDWFFTQKAIQTGMQPPIQHYVESYLIDTTHQIMKGVWQSVNHAQHDLLYTELEMRDMIPRHDFQYHNEPLAVDNNKMSSVSFK